MRVIYGDIFVVLRAILKSNCYHKGGPDAPCEYADGLFMLLFGVVQVLFSQIPDLHNMELLSIIAAIMSFGCTLSGPILAFVKVLRNFKSTLLFISLSF